MTEFFGGSDSAAAVAIQSDGRIVAAGAADAGFRWALVRYDTDGSLDQTFDGDGRLVTNFFGEAEEAFDLAIQPDGRIVAAGKTGTDSFEEQASEYDFALARYRVDGSLDPSFGGDGRVTTNFTGASEHACCGTTDEARGVAIQADGRIVAAGTSEAGANPSNFALARYLDLPTRGQLTGDAVALFVPDPTTGVLTQPAGAAGCVSETGSGGQSADGRGLDGASSSLAVSASGRSVYAASRLSDAVARFARRP